jgi:micrococcal nuclease
LPRRVVQGMHVRLLALFALLCLVTLQANAYEGTVSHVSDGDTLWVQPAKGGAPRALRLDGIDAPEICQAHGTAARDALAARLLHRQVAVRTRSRDSYQRTLAAVSLDGQDMGAWMVARGHAWAHRFHGRAGAYAKQESAARSKRLGLWAQAQPVEPRAFRRKHGACH